MRVDFTLHDIAYTVSRLVRALSNNLTPEDNFGPSGTAGQVLTSNGPNAAPSYQDASGGATEATSLGGNADVYAGTVGDTLQFRGLTAGTGIDLTENANDIEVAIDQTALDDLYVNETGDTMTGDLEIEKATAGLQMHSTGDTDAEITFLVNSINRWLIRSGNLADGYNLQFLRYSGGAWVVVVDHDIPTGSVLYEAHLLPRTTDLYDVGGSGLRWRNGTFNGTVDSTRVTVDNLARTVNARGNSTGIFNLNFDSGAVVTMTLTGNVTIGFTGTAVLTGALYTLIFTQDGTGGRTVAWSGSLTIRWEGGAAYGGGAVAGVRDIVYLLHIGGGIYYGWFKQAFA